MKHFIKQAFPIFVVIALGLSSCGVIKTGTNEYYVSEYNSTPLANLTKPEGCESPRTKVIVEIKATAAPIVTALSDVEVCAKIHSPMSCPA